MEVDSTSTAIFTCCGSGVKSGAHMRAAFIARQDDRPEPTSTGVTTEKLKRRREKTTRDVSVGCKGSYSSVSKTVSEELR